jgi:hypothetical protein
VLFGTPASIFTTKAQSSRSRNPAIAVPVDL